jgi:hypothetical protein
LGERVNIAEDQLRHYVLHLLLKRALSVNAVRSDVGVCEWTRGGFLGLRRNINFILLHCIFYTREVDGGVGGAAAGGVGSGASAAAPGAS